MSEKHDIFDNAGEECPRFYTREECQETECPEPMSKTIMSDKYAPKVDIREVYTKITGPYVPPVRYAHGQNAHAICPQ